MGIRLQLVQLVSTARRSVGIRLQLVQLVPPGQWVSDCSSSNWYRQEVSGYQTATGPTGTAMSVYRMSPNTCIEYLLEKVVISMPVDKGGWTVDIGGRTVDIGRWTVDKTYEGGRCTK